MGNSDILRNFLQNVRTTSWLEWVSTAAQILSVWYARKNDVRVYPTGIIGVLLASYLYFFSIHPPLYADGTLNLYYFIMSIYGWYNWLQKKDADHLAFPIRWCARRERVAGLVLFAGVWLVLWAVLDRLTNSNTPVLDSLVSASAVTAMWWMATRKIENWLAWIFSNVVAIPLNYYKGLMLFTLMYLLFLILAVWGYIDWKKQVQKG